MIRAMLARAGRGYPLGSGPGSPPAASTASRSRPGALVRGATVRRTARFLGRECTYAYVATAHGPDTSVELRGDRPVPMLVRYELTDAGDGDTLAAIHASGTPGRFVGWATPVMRRQVRRSIAGDLERLRSALEA